MLLNVCMSVQMTKRRHVHVCPMMTRTGPDGPVNRSEPGLLWQTDSCLLLSLEGVWFLTQSPHKPTHPHQSSFICCPRSLLPYHLSHDAPSPLSTATTPTCLLFLNEVHLFNLPDPPAWLWLHLDCENEQRQLQKECELRAHSSHYVAKALPACLMKGNNGASPWDTPLNLTPPTHTSLSDCVVNSNSQGSTQTHTSRWVFGVFLYMTKCHTFHVISHLGFTAWEMPFRAYRLPPPARRSQKETWVFEACFKPKEKPQLLAVDNGGRSKK